MTLVKICGLTRAEDAERAAQLGADYLGFVFVRESPRCVDAEFVRGIGGAKKVGVFRNAPLDEMERVAKVARLDLIQLHGHESEDDVRALALPVIKAFHVEDALPQTNTAAQYVMFDTGGGTGRRFDWTLLAEYDRARPFFLAGGITPDNVEDALRARPYAIDLSSGVERAPGIKDHHQLQRLFERVKR
ncbi:MAG TPA: phosphoribosylanthranilate isomerase [Thermoanaerobaculia bacterium]|nr:phosphoribosylanthranilate isomerase [Thermoanaerobaculia bacterium]